MNTESIERMVKGALGSLGLGDFLLQNDPHGSCVIRRPDGQLLLKALLSVELDSYAMSTHDGACEEVRRAFGPIQESILASPLILEIQTELDKLRKCVADLEPYKTHYKLAFLLQNGKLTEGYIR